jgi:hypothetical protein
MAAGNTYTAIAEQTLGSAAASVTFSSIPQTYTDLVFVLNARTVSAVTGVQFFCRINGDSATNYSWTQVAGDGSTAYSDRLTNDAYCRLGNVAGSSAASGTFSPNIINFQNYSNTTTNKTILTRGSTAGSEVLASVSLWRSTSAISSVVFYVAGLANWDTGSTFSLYGIAAA